MKNYKYWIALEQTKGIGPVHLREIHQSLSRLDLSIVDLFALDQREIEKELSLSPAIARGVRDASDTLPVIEENYYTMLDAGISVTVFFEDMYPVRLKTLLKNEYPPILYTLGNLEIFRKKGAAIIGDINISQKGELITYLAARELCAHHITVISGLARGADMTAHRSALENGGTTMALLPYGFAHLKIPEILKNVFVPDNALLVSPFFLNREYSPYLAMQRNRIICALSLAAFIVESPKEGGIFEAAKSAKNIGVPLYTVEYTDYPESAMGNSFLINEMGAHPVRGRMINDLLTPNLDRLIGDVKFSN